MQIFLTAIGFGTCATIVIVAILKVTEAVDFVKDFRDTVTDTLAKIEERLNSPKP